MRTAKLIKDRLPDFLGYAALYELTPPLTQAQAEHFCVPKHHRFVVVSAVATMFSGPETYIFTADETGEVTSFAELEGSFRGGLDHARALAGVGYSIVKE